MTTRKPTTTILHRDIKIIKDYNANMNGGKGGYDYIVGQPRSLGLHAQTLPKDFRSAAAAKRYIDSRLDRDCQ